MGLKLIYLLLYWKHNECLYLDAYEYVLLEGVADLKKYILVLLAFQFGLIVFFYYKFAALLKSIEKKYMRFLDED